jgi:hypothetical protein
MAPKCGRKDKGEQALIQNIRLHGTFVKRQFFTEFSISDQ